MKRLTAVSLLLLFAFLTSCRKHNETPPPTATETGGSHTALGNLRTFSTSAEARTAKGALVARVTNTPSSFLVDFNGLITIAKMTAGDDSTPRRAIAVEGNPSMMHVAMLIVDAPVTPADVTTLTTELATYTGHSVNCSDPNFPGECTVEFTGADLRIRGDGGTVATGTLTNDASFNCLVHSLYQISGKGTLLPALLIPAALPASPSSGFFEIDGGGTLLACPFTRKDQSGGYYDNDPNKNCIQFAEDAYWKGTTTGTAILQIRSMNTPNHDWIPLHINNSGRLNVGIVNEPPPPMTPSSAHFALFDKILATGRVPGIVVCPNPTICVTCGPGREVLVPGCSDTQYP